MSENIINTLITATASILGAIIGAYATIYVASVGRIKETGTSFINKPPRNRKRIILGAAIGAALFFLPIWFFSQKYIDTTPITGDWSGRMDDDNSDASIKVTIHIDGFCYEESLCGTIYIPAKSYRADLKLISTSGDVFKFEETNIKGSALFGSGGYNYIHTQIDGTLFRLFTSHDGAVTSRGTLNRQ